MSDSKVATSNHNVDTFKKKKRSLGQARLKLYQLQYLVLFKSSARDLAPKIAKFDNASNPYWQTGGMVQGASDETPIGYSPATFGVKCRCFLAWILT